MAKFTYEEFKRQYPTNEACLDKIFQLRYAHLPECPKCGRPAAWRKVCTRRCYQCRHCYEQFYPTAGTVFEKTRRPLVDWFFVIWLFTTTRNGVAAKEVERQLGVGYKTAFRMTHCIRTLMKKIGPEKLKGFVELDETYVSKGKSKTEKNEAGRSAKNQTPVFGMVERMGNVKAFALENVRKEIIFPLIKTHVDATAKISTDEFKLYVNINSELGMQHGTVMHQLKQYRINDVSTNTIEGFFGQLKRMIGGTHLHVSATYLNNYVAECVFRYNNRKNQNGMFDAILLHLPLFEEVL